jgi:hypothetical protein
MRHRASRSAGQVRFATTFRLAAPSGGKSRDYWSTKVPAVCLSARRSHGTGSSLHTYPSGPTTATPGHAADRAMTWLPRMASARSVSARHPQRGIAPPHWPECARAHSPRAHALSPRPGCRPSAAGWTPSVRLGALVPARLCGRARYRGTSNLPNAAAFSALRSITLPPAPGVASKRSRRRSLHVGQLATSALQSPEPARLCSPFTSRADNDERWRYVRSKTPSPDRSDNHVA